MPYLMINGVKQEFETFGDVHKPALIMLYGGATNASTWRGWNYNNTLLKLSEENYVIAFDRRGHGSSDCPKGTTLTDMARDLVALMDTLCIEKASAVGMSAGTYLLGCAAGVAPERFTSQILIVPNIRTSNGSPGTNFARKRGNPDPETSQRMAFSPNTPEALIESYFAWNDKFSCYPTPSREIMINAFDAISEFDHTENFKNMQAPVLVLSGEHDLINPPEAGKEIAEVAPNGKYVEFSDCGHMLFNEKNDECVRIIMEFLRSVN